MQNLFDEDMLSKASGWLKLRTATKYRPIRRVEDKYFSLHCEHCKLVFGEIDAEPIYTSESALLAEWNHRKY